MALRATENPRVAGALCALTLAGVSSCAPSASVGVAVPAPADRTHVEAAAAGPARTFRPIDSEVQLFDDEFLRAIEEIGYLQTSVWPRELPKKALPITDVQVSSLVQAEEVAKLMLRPEWVPDGLRNKWMPFRWTGPGMSPKEIDCLYYRYQVDGVRIQIREDGTGMSVLIDPGQHARPAPSVEEYVVDMAPRFLTLPSLPRPPKFWTCWTRVLEDGRRMTSALCFTRQDPVALALKDYMSFDEDIPPWWPCISFFSDGHFLLVGVNGQDLRRGGKERNPVMAGPYPRFRGSKPVQPKGSLGVPPAQPWQEPE